MTRWLDDPEGAADALIASVMADGRGPAAGARVLASYQYGDGAAILRAAGCAADVWNRHMRGRRPASAAPPEGPFDVCIMRLPKPRLEQEMALHQMLAVTRAGGGVYVYGGNDEGIKSFQKTFAALVDGAETIATRGHGRVLFGVRDERLVRGGLDDWIQRGEMPIDGVGVPWVSYPGLFAAGALDPGTALLLHALRAIVPEGRILDFGAGTGMIARTLDARAPSIDLTLVDNDSVALMAAGQNVPGSRLVLGDTLDALPAGEQFDMIVSNPPLHAGVREDHGALEALVAQARSKLPVDGSLWMVVQRRVVCQPMLEAVFEEVETVADDGRYRVWRADKPKSALGLKGAGRRRGRP